MTAARKLPEPTLLALEKIRLDGGTQSRASLNEDTIAEYSEVVSNLPPVDVFFDGETYWLADGFHRHAGFTRAERKKIPCIVHQGTQRDAVLFSVGANDAHGLRRTNADKRRAVMLLLKDEEWGRKSDRWVAGHCGVSDPFVGKLRAEVQTVSTSSKRTGQDGKSYPAAKPKKPDPAPKSEPRAVAPAPAFEQCERHGCKFDVGSECPVCAHREAKGLKDVQPPAPSKWECPDCHSWWPEDVDICRECSAAEHEANDTEYFDPDIALEATDQAFEEMMQAWPRTASLAPVVKWLKVKLGMTEQEASQWPTK